MIFYNFYTDRYRSPENLVYRTEEGFSPLQVNMKMFPQKEGEDGAEKDFFALLWDNPDYRIGEYFNTEKKKKIKVEKELPIPGETPIYSVIPPDYKLELDKVYNLDCLLFMNTVPDKYIDYIFTSPPYNIKKQIGTDDLYKVYSDDLTPEEYFDWLCAIIDEGMRVTKKHFFMNIQMLGKNKHSVLGLMSKYKHIIKDIAIWQKTIVAPHIQPGIMNSGFEFIFIFSNDRPELKVFSDAKWSQGTFSNVIKGLNASQNKYSDLNKATFPLFLPRVFMQKFGKPRDIWYDPFSGTGTTFHAATIEDKYFLGTEIDIEQCEVTNKRIFIEESAQKIDFDNPIPNYDKGGIYENEDLEIKKLPENEKVIQTGFDFNEPKIDDELPFTD